MVLGAGGTEPVRGATAGLTGQAVAGPYRLDYVHGCRQELCGHRCEGEAAGRCHVLGVRGRLQAGSLWL